MQQRDVSIIQALSVIRMGEIISGPALNRASLRGGRSRRSNPVTLHWIAAPLRGPR
jgi:hypothetical protein